MSSPSDQKSTDCNHEIVINDKITTCKIPETCVDEPPTEDQNKKLLEFEEEFKSRYTDDDEEYVATVKLGYTTPPLIPTYRPFWNRRRDNKRVWDDRGDRNNRHSHGNRYSPYRNHNSGFNNDYRR